MFDPLNWDELDKNIFQDGIPESRLGWVPSQITPGMMQNNKYLYVSFDNTKLVSSGLKPNDDESLVYIAEPKSNRIKETIRCLIRLRETGIGTISFCVKICTKDDRLILFNGLEQYLRLTPRTWHHIFNNTVSQKNENSYLANILLKNSTTKISLFELFLRAISYLEVNGVKDFKLQSESKDEPKVQLNFLKQQDEFKFGILKSNYFFEKMKPSVKITDTTHPYLYISTKMPDKNYSRFFMKEGYKKSKYKNKSIHDIGKQVVALLYRFFELEHYKYLDDEAIKQEFECDINSQLFSRHNINSLFFSHIYRMAAFSCAPDSEMFPYELISRSIFDMLESGRAKVFGFEFANYWLDQLIYELNDNFTQESLDAMLIPLIRIQRIITLCAADPSIMFYDGHVAYDIVDLVYKKLNVAALQPMVIDKLNMFRALVSNVQSDIRQREFYQYPNS